MSSAALQFALILLAAVPMGLLAHALLRRRGRIAPWRLYLLFAGLVGGLPSEPALTCAIPVNGMGVLLFLHHIIATLRVISRRNIRILLLHHSFKLPEALPV